MSPPLDGREMELASDSKVKDLVVCLQNLGLQVLETFHDYCDKVERAITMTMESGFSDQDEMAQVTRQEEKVQHEVQDLKNALKTLGCLQTMLNRKKDPVFDSANEVMLKVPRDIMNLEDIQTGSCTRLNTRRKSTGHLADPRQVVHAMQTLLGHGEITLFDEALYKCTEMSVQTDHNLSQSDLSLAGLDEVDIKRISGNTTPVTAQTDFVPDSIATTDKPCTSDELELATDKQDGINSSASHTLDDPESIIESPRSEPYEDEDYDGVESLLSLEFKSVEDHVPVAPSPFIKSRDYPDIFAATKSTPKNELTVVILEETSGELGQVAITLQAKKPTVAEVRKALTEKYGEAATSNIRLVIRSNGYIVNLRDSDKLLGRRAFVVGLDSTLVNA